MLAARQLLRVGVAQRVKVGGVSGVRGVVAPANRRKNNNKNNNPDAGEDTPAGFTEVPLYDFDYEVAIAIKNLYEGILPMKDANKNFDLEYLPDVPELNIYTRKGKLQFMKDTSRPVLIYTSFCSGNLNYCFPPEDGLWRSDRDEHDLRGIVLRDLIKFNAGMPKFT